MRPRIKIIIAMVLSLTVLIGFSATKASHAHRVLGGVKVDTMDLSGLSGEQVSGSLNTLADRVAQRQIAVMHEQKKHYYQAAELGVSLDVPATTKRAMQAGRKGSVWQQMRHRYAIKTQGLVLAPVLGMDKIMLEKRINANFGEIIKQPVDAGFKVTTDDQVEIVPGVAGYKVDYQALATTIIKAVSADLSEKQTAALEVDLPLPLVQPQKNREDIEAMGITGLVASFSTVFDPQQVDRTYNMQVAAAALDRLLVAPQEEFSFNKIVGPRSFEAGYKNATVIVNNEFVEGVGGGVCQVSSTLYNAVLLAGLKISARSNHSLPISYVPIGRDATVVYDAVDFKFINNQSNYIYIKSRVQNNTLTCKLYGYKENLPVIELSSEVLEEIQPRVVYEKNPNFAKGQQIVKQQGAKGYRVATTRTIWQGETKITENLSPSYYQPVHRIIALGTGAAAPAVVTPQPGDAAAGWPDEDTTLPGGDIPREQSGWATIPEKDHDIYHNADMHKPANLPEQFPAEQ